MAPRGGATANGRDTVWGSGVFKLFTASCCPSLLRVTDSQSNFHSKIALICHVSEFRGPCLISLYFVCRVRRTSARGCDQLTAHVCHPYTPCGHITYLYATPRLRDVKATAPLKGGTFLDGKHNPIITFT